MELKGSPDVQIEILGPTILNYKKKVIDIQKLDTMSPARINIVYRRMTNLCPWVATVITRVNYSGGRVSNTA